MYTLIITLLLCIVMACCAPLRPLYGSPTIVPYDNITLGNIQCNGCSPRLIYTIHDVVQQIVQSKMTDSSPSRIESGVHFILDINLSYDKDRMGVVSSGSATRISNKMVLEYIIREVWSGKIVKQRKIMGIETIPVAYSSFTTFFTEAEHANNMLNVMLAELFIDVQILFKKLYY